jgi:hypothetical protein
MSKGNYTRPAIAVTDGAETTITALTFCQAVYIAESSAASGWPRAFLVRGTTPGSAQHTVAAGTNYRIPGAFVPGDTVATVELVSNGGDSSTFNVAELSA